MPRPRLAPFSPQGYADHSKEQGVFIAKNVGEFVPYSLAQRDARKRLAKVDSLPLRDKAAVWLFGLNRYRRGYKATAAIPFALLTDKPIVNLILYAPKKAWMKSTDNSISTADL